MTEPIPIPIAVQVLLGGHHRIHTNQDISVEFSGKLETDFPLLPELFQRLGRPARETYVRTPMITGFNKGALVGFNDKAAPDL